MVGATGRQDSQPGLPLARLYDPTEGIVYLDGVDVATSA